MTDYPRRIVAKKKLIKKRRPLMPVINADTDKLLHNISITNRRDSWRIWNSRAEQGNI